MIKKLSLFMILFILSPLTRGSDALGEDPGPVYTKMIQEWMKVTNFAENGADVAVGKLKAEMSEDPALQKWVTSDFTADLKQFFYELFISQEMIKDMAKLYAQYFTLDEMLELIQFYKTPLGQKLVKSNTVLTLKSQQIGEDLFKKHEREYMEVVKKYVVPSR